MLRGLTDRPNVQSTLILSKRDGSIIRATGITDPEKPEASSAAITYQWPRGQSGNHGAEGNQGNAVAEVKTGGSDAQDMPKPVELLASSIFHFVNNAAALGVTLGAVSRYAAGQDGVPSGPSYINTKPLKHDLANDEEPDSGPGEDDLQLLRLRTKHQEIIVFPDPNYICCVVQRVGKAGNPSERR